MKRSMHALDHSMYQQTVPGEARKILENAEWKMKSDVDVEYTEQMILSTYSGKQSFGAMDYEDHRKDSLEQLKKKIIEKIGNDTYQRLHVYDENGVAKNLIITYGYLGGYTSYFAEKRSV